MATKIRLARGGSKKRPHYSIVLSDSRMPRDGQLVRITAPTVKDAANLQNIVAELRQQGCHGLVWGA